MAFIVTAALPSDAETLIRNCDFPALQGNPLHELMFPQKTAEDSEEIIQWMIDDLRSSLHDPRMKFFKACTNDGTIIGFAGWTVPIWAKKEPPSVEYGYIEHKTRDSQKFPKALDVESWIRASKQPSAEKRRVIKDQDAIYRLNLISVNPAYQGKGVGSMLMAWGCRQADESNTEAFVMASPAALRLYRKFGFDEVGTVQIGAARFSSMMRKPAYTHALMGPVD